MPLRSEAQRRWMHANHPKMAKRWEKHTPKDKKLPKRVKKAFLEGALEAFERFGIKYAAEEIRLQLPRREFHGLDESFRKENRRNAKQAEEAQPPQPVEEDNASPDAPPQDTPVIEALIQHLEGIDGIPADDENIAPDPHDPKSPSWSAPTDPTTSTAGGQLSGVRPAQPVGIGY